MTKAYNRTGLKSRRRELRKNMPLPEIILWSRLKGRGLNGYKFRRQYSVGRYIMDFYCPELKLAVEIDGDTHFSDGREEKDRARERLIESYGITFLRFTNIEVNENIEGVLGKIAERLPEKRGD